MALYGIYVGDLLLYTLIIHREDCVMGSVWVKVEKDKR